MKNFATEQKALTKLIQAVIERGFYQPRNVFHHEPTFYKEPEASKYLYKVHIHKWNTRSTGVTILGARWDEKAQKFIVSTYKMNPVKRYAHGEKMR